MEQRPVLDRLPEFDEKSRDFQIRGLLNAAPARKPISKLWKVGSTLDQGREGACVGFSMTHRLMSEPVMNVGLTNRTAQELYKLAQRYDQWPGENYSGTSVLGGVKAARAKGYVGAFHWVGAGSGRVMDDIKDSLSYVGPVVFGINWMESMFEPRPSGLLEVDTTKIAGGHAICAVGLQLGTVLGGEQHPMDLVVFQNSWGPRWGIRGGMCYMKLEDLEKLMGMQGEGLVITQENLVRRGW